MPPDTKKQSPKPEQPAVDPLSAFNVGASTLRVLISLLMQAAVVVVLFIKAKDSGLFGVIGTYLRAYNPLIKPCGLLPHKEFVILSDRVVQSYGMAPGLGE
jgi:hypothetical protein